jgi:hypothetical protein
MRALYRSRLEQNYAKAVARAAKKGLDLGPREETYQHWGANYTLDGPWSHPHYLTTELYATDPTSVNAGDGIPGGCVAGTCGGSGGCGSGTVLMCGTTVSCACIMLAFDETNYNCSIIRARMLSSGSVRETLEF